MDIKDYLKILSENEIVRGVQLVLSDFLQNIDNIDLPRRDEYNITIQIPETLEGDVYPEVILDAYLFKPNQSLSLKNMRIISREKIDKGIDFELCIKPLNNDKATVLYSDTISESNTIISDMSTIKLDTGYLYIKLTNCNGNRIPLDFVLNLKLND